MKTATDELVAWLRMAGNEEFFVDFPTPDINKYRHKLIEAAECIEALRSPVGVEAGDLLYDVPMDWMNLSVNCKVMATGPDYVLVRTLPGEVFVFGGVTPQEMVKYRQRPGKEWA